MTLSIKYYNKMIILYTILRIIDTAGVFCGYFICCKKMSRKKFCGAKNQRKRGGWEKFEKKGGLEEKGQGQIKRGAGPPVAAMKCSTLFIFSYIWQKQRRKSMQTQHKAKSGYLRANLDACIYYFCHGWLIQAVIKCLPQK